MCEINTILVKLFQKYQLRQLRQSVFLRRSLVLAIRLRKLHTKHLFVLNSSKLQLLGTPITKRKFSRLRRRSEQLSIKIAGDGRIRCSDRLEIFERQFPVVFCYITHFLKVSLEKYKYPAPFRRTSAFKDSHSTLVILHMVML